jgi:hypothetical protein
MDTMNNTMTLTLVREVELARPITSVVPPGFGRDSGQRWLITHYRVRTEVVSDGFGRYLQKGDADFSAFGKRLTKAGTTTGASHLIYWVHHEGDLVND